MPSALPSLLISRPSKIPMLAGAIYSAAPTHLARLGVLHEERGGQPGLALLDRPDPRLRVGRGGVSVHVRACVSRVGVRTWLPHTDCPTLLPHTNLVPQRLELDECLCDLWL